MTDFLFDGPEGAATTLLLAHGAGAPMDSAAMTAVAKALAGEGLRVARFEFGYMAARRTGGRRQPPRAERVMPEYVAAVAALDAPGRLVIGGKSMGGRVASMVADGLHAEGRVAGLLCLGYPFHPPGRPGQLRTAHLERLTTPALICQGTRDPFGTREEVAGYALSPAIEILWLEDGDHDLRPRKAVSGLTAADHLRTVAARVAAWAGGLPGLKIATFNVNNVIKRLGNLLAWLETSAPDVVCLQELKAAEPDFPAAALAEAGYGAVWRGQRSWNGVAILARDAEPVLTRDALPGDPEDRQPRYIEAAVGGVLVGCLYAPNGNPAPGPKFDYKLAWHARFEAHAAELLAAGVPVVLAGDYNVVPEPRDIYPTSSYDGNALIRPESRAAFRRLLDQGWTDALRAAFPEETVYTFWDYRRNRWERNGGMRLDHFLLSRELAPRLTGAGVDREVRGAENASDHAPAWIELGEPRRKR